MDKNDATDAFLQSLPEVGKDEEFTFACHPDVACFNACCGDLTLQLTPYDVYRLRKNLGLSSREFIQKHADVFAAPDTGFPMLRLRMMAREPGRPCPYVTTAGCSVYPDRPGACRTYPIGRATRLGDQGEVVEQFFLVREDHCKGFFEKSTFTPATWTQDQELQTYNASNDRLVRIMARQKKLGKPVDAKMTNMLLLALYQLDSFQRFTRDMGIFKRLNVPPERQEEILTNEEEALLFAMEWAELILFGPGGR